MHRNIFSIIKEKGLKNGISYIIKKLDGRYNMEDEISTLHYLLDKCCDMEKFPKAEGPLRALQECDLELLKVFDVVCKKFDIKYWLNWGTLLGAKRHQGFIPWDDDMDVGVLREDYEKMLTILPNYLKEYGIDVCELPNRKMMSIGFSFKHLETGLWLDVFPVDFSKESPNLLKKLNKYKKYYYKRKSDKSFDKLKIESKKTKLIKQCNDLDLDGSERIYFHGMEFDHVGLFFFEHSTIFPLNIISFEGYSFSCPNNVDKYLSTIYGKSFMKYPSHGIQKHSKNDGCLADRMNKHNINFEDVIASLKDVYQCIITNDVNKYGEF